MTDVRNNMPLEDIALSVSSVIRTSRELKGYSVEELAVACGLSMGELNDIEAGARAAPSVLRRIAAVLGFPADIAPQA